MVDVYVGEGALAGKGLYAGRSFAEGDVVVEYRLRKLSRAEYLALPEAETLFVHSYWGERYMYPAPARYLNHSEAPNTVQDFERQCNIALCPIAEGKFVTTDAAKETDRELVTFLIAYETAVNAGDHHRLASLIDDRAVLWLPGEPAATKARLVDERAGGATGEGAGGVSLSIRDTSWIIGTGRWEAVCSYNFEVRSAGMAWDAASTGHVTDVLEVVDGNWQIIYRHVSSP